METIGQIGKRFALARSTLLYYDSIGLLKPSGRSAANYRRYSEADLHRLELICRYRKIGLPLKTVKEILDSPGGKIAAVLENRLEELNAQIRELRNQQHIIVRILQQNRRLTNIKVMNKKTWIALLQSAGLDEQGMHTWHVEFEKLSPAEHQAFLESLGIPADEIKSIRRFSALTQQRKAAR